MRWMWVLLRAVFAVMLMLSAPVWAQNSLGEDRADETDRGFVAGLLEDALGGDGRTVRIIGFAGALSSTATIDRVTIADDDGIWLDMRDLSMEWNRSALLRGRIEIATLSAASIAVNRAPEPAPQSGPSPEAGSFELPDLPVSVAIDAFEIATLSLAPAIVGEALEARVTANARYASAALDVALTAERSDGREGQFVIEAAFDNATKATKINVDFREAAGGVVAKALDLRGAPSLELKVAGQGPLSELGVDLRLSTDGAERFGGTLVLRDVNSGAGLGFQADLSGDLRPLFPQDYAAFFGQNADLRAQGEQSADGGFDVPEFTLRTRAADLKGAVTLAPNNWPKRIDVTGRLAAPDGERLVLPANAGQTSVARVDLNVDYDQTRSDRWTGAFEIADLITDQLRAEAVSLKANGRLQPPDAGNSDLSADIVFDALGLQFENAALQDAVGTAIRGRARVEQKPDAPLTLRDFELGGSDYALSGQADTSGFDDAFKSDFDLDLVADDIARFSALSGLELGGRIAVNLDGFATAAGAFDLDIAGTGNALRTGIAQADAVLAGQTDLRLSARRDETGTRLPVFSIRNPQADITGTADLETGLSRAQVSGRVFDAALIDPSLSGEISFDAKATQNGAIWLLDATGIGPFDTEVAVDGPVTGPSPRIAFAARIPRVQDVTDLAEGPADLRGVLSRPEDDWVIRADVAGPLGATATMAGRVTGQNAPDVTFKADLANTRALVPQLNGPASISGTAINLPDGIQVKSQLQGPSGISATVEGRVTGEAAPDISFDADLANVSTFVPQLSGPASASGRAVNTADGLAVDATIRGPYALEATVSGRATGTSPALDFTARLPNVAPIASGISGPLAVQGRAQQVPGAWQINTSINGPANSSATVSGRVAGSDLNLAINGSAPLGLSEPFLSPRSLTGLARFDLRLDGSAELGSLSGTINTSGARFVAPGLRATLNDIATTIRLQNGVADLDASAAVATGGRVNASGRVALQGGFDADLGLQMTNVTLSDPKLYELQSSGRVSVRGPLTGGARITGAITVDEAQVQLPTATAPNFSIVPQISHRNAPRAVRQTLTRAGVTPGQTDSRSGAGPAYGLDVTVDAPARIFVRGRGLDAELGGQVRLSGSTNALVSAGAFELIRGRLDLLGKRFVLDVGRVVLQGQFDPFIEFAATTKTDEGTARIIIEGPVSEPQVRFESSPDRPEDEVLAQIFFGRSVTQLTPFQALQLASAVATLSGGGSTVMSSLRMQFGLDDLDVTTDDTGAVGLRLGKYISDNIYTDVVIGDRDDAGVSLNIDVSPNVTLKGTVESDGDSSIGVFFEKDY